MSPASRFSALLASITASIMFVILSYAGPKLAAANVAHPIWLSIGAFLTSAGCYRLLSLGLNWLMARLVCVRKLVLGPHYMHGTWVGWFTGHGGDLRFMVEYFVQDLDSLVITGRSFTDQLVQHGQWKSESVTIDVRHGMLVFTYLFDVITNKSSLSGVHNSVFERASANHAPTAISGFAHDLNDPTRIAVHSEKVSDLLLPWADALKLAQQRHK